MANIDAALWATAGLASGPWLYFRGFRTMRTRRLIADTPTARVRSMAMGLVEVNGAVEPRSTLRAPFSGKPCAYWEVDVAIQTRRSWRIVHRNQSGNPFYLSDDTGVAMVYPHGSECRIRFGTEETCPGLTLPACYAEYLDAHTSVFGRLARIGYLRFRERILEAGQRVYVLGTATPRSQAHTIAGADEVQATGTDGAVVTRRDTLDRELVAVVRRGENESTFIISQDSEKGLMLTLGARAILQLVGGPLLTLAGLGYWVVTLSSGRMPW